MGRSKASLSAEDLWDYHVDFQIKNRPMGEHFEDRDLIHHFTGRVVYQPEEKKVTIGKIRGQKIDWGEAVNSRRSLFDACDASQELYDVYATIFDTKTSQVREDLGIDGLGDVLIVHEMKIVPKFRGRGLGLLAMLQTMKTIGGGCALTVIKPFPLQFTGEVDEKNEKEFSEAQDKLCNYWGRLGFERVEDSDYFIVDLAHVQPTAEDLLGIKLEI